MGVSKQIKNKINKLTYDKVKFNTKLAQAKKSYDEVKKMINGKW